MQYDEVFVLYVRSDIWGLMLRLGPKYSAKISRSQLKGIMRLSGETCPNFWRFVHVWGGLFPQLDPWVQNFCNKRSWQCLGHM